MEKQKNIPQLRFPEFEKEWVKDSFENICIDVMYGMNASATTFDGKHKYLRITDIDEDSREFKPNPLTSPAGNIDSQFKLKRGDIVFARTGASVGKSYLYKEEDGDLYFAGFLIKFSITDANPYFVYTQTLRNTYNKWVTVMSMRSGQPGINAEEYKSYEFKLPTLPEQQKIASFFTAIDKKISQLKRKKTLLEQYKKGVMQKIFLQEIRFKDDNGQEFPKWEKKKLGEVSTINPSTNKLPDKFIYIDLESVNNGELTKEVIVFKNDAPSRAQRVLEKNDILFQTVRPYQKNNLYFDRDGDYVASTGYAQIKTKQSSRYIYQYLHLQKFVDEVIERCTGTSYPAINAKDLAKICICYPTLPEQAKIASFLSAIDDKINHTQKQIDITEVWKKGLMQQMFV